MNYSRTFTLAIDLSKELPGIEPPPPSHAVLGVVLYQYFIEQDQTQVSLTAVAAFGVNLMKMLSEEQINWIEDYLRETHGTAQKTEC